MCAKLFHPLSSLSLVASSELVCHSSERNIEISSERNIEIRANIRAFHLELFLCQLINNGADNHSGVLVRTRD